jgi:hypothetical protein
LKKTQKISKKFIGFLIASILIWLLITLSKEYVTTITLPVSYKELPQDKLLQSTPIKEIVIQVKASGFKIIRTNLKKKPIVIQTNNLLKKSVKDYYILAKRQKNNIQKQLLNQVQLLEILPDTIFLELGSLTSKKIPVKPTLDIHYHVGYDVLEPIKITPDSVIISGPESQVKNIKSLDLASLKLNDVKADFAEKVTIKKPLAIDNIKLNTRFVTISGTVEKFTEKSFPIPFNIVNLPENMELNTLSKNVEIVFIVGLSNFNKIDKNSFVVECDFSVSEKNNLSYLIPKVVRKPDLIKSFRVIPNKIDFLIQK